MGKNRILKYELSYKRCKMKKGIVFLLFVICLLLTFNADALDNPHNINNTVNCGNCHTTALPGSTLPGWWANQDQTTGVCGQCHNAAAAGTDVKGHSSANTSTQYGTWSKKCTDCHNPHNQRQSRIYKAPSYFYSGVSTGITLSTLTKAGAGWTNNEWAEKVLIPNVAYPGINYRILSNTTETITINTGGGDAISLKYLKSGQTFAIVYETHKRNSWGKWVRFLGRQAQTPLQTEAQQ